MNDIGTINMRMPNGRKSQIVVSLNPRGNIDLIFRRSSVGEVLVGISIL